ncbi:MAG TPA: hypothetical protein VLK36_06015 [Gaiellaceae bacterium]|nr:hypothetical protein [Gaiellaceae bacterium]
MFISFVQLPPPNSIDDGEAKLLRELLLHGTPSDAAAQAAGKIEQAAARDGALWALSRPEVEAIVTALGEGSSPGSETTERLRWIEQQLRLLLDDETAF